MFELKEYIILFLIWLISTIFIRSIFKNRSTFPPRPRGLPIIGHLHLLRPIPHQALYKLANKYGPLMHLYLGSSPLLVVSSPEMAKEFLKNNETLFSNRPQTSAIKYLTYGSQDFSFAPYGPYWKFMKKLVMSELLGGRTVESLLPVRNQERSTLLKRILSKAKEGKEIDVGGELIRMSNNVISRMLMGKRCSEEENDAGDVRHLIQEVAELAGTFNLGDYIWFLKNLDLQGVKKRSKVIRDKFDVMMHTIIKEHQETRKNKMEKNEYVKDLLHLLLDIAEDETAEFRLTRENIKAFMLDIFVAGSDTSAISTEWALAEMLKNPKIMQKAVKEIDSIIGKNKLVEEADVANLPYLQAVVRETLRLYPTAPIIVRESSEDCTVLGIPIPAKTRTYVNVWASNRDPNHWENPLEFQPQRFLTVEGDGKGQLDVRGQHYHFLPFGSGRRGCPGTSLALQVVHTTLANMIQCFEWKVKGELNMEEGHGITLPRAHSLVCFPKARVGPLPMI